MATSGSIDFSLDRDGIIAFALKKAGIIATAATPSTNQISDAAIELNAMVKHWQVDGLQLFAKKQGFMFLAADTSKYQLGGTGADHATNTYYQTALNGAHAASAISLTVDSISNISASDNIGIELADGTLHWDTVSGSPSGTTVTLTTGLASAASDDAVVYTYTTNINKPLRLLSLYRRDKNVNDVYIDPISLDEYSEFSNKNTDGKVTQLAFSPQNTYSDVYIWPQTDDVTDIIGFWYHRPFEDFDASTDDPDFPSEWTLTLAYGLAAHLAVTYGTPTRKELLSLAEFYKMEMEDWDQEQGSLYFEPERI